MDFGSAEGLIVFLLAAVPGVVLLELVRFRRPRLRGRGNLQTFAAYLVASGAAWGVAAILRDADGRLASAIRLGRTEATRLVDAYGELAIDLLAAAVGLGLALRLLARLGGRLGFGLLSRVPWERKWIRGFARLIAIGIAPFYAWDEILARLQRRGQAQLVNVRFQDGSSLVGVFAGSGRGDFEVDGRGLVLDKELRVDESGQLTEVSGSTGVFVSPSSVMSISFADYQPSTGDRAGNSVSPSQ